MKLKDNVKRQRQNLIRIFLNDEELEILEKACEDAGNISKSKFLRELIIEYKN